MTEEQERIATACRAAAEHRRYDAGMNGMTHDGGAQTLEALVDAWVAGLNGDTPEHLRDIAERHGRPR